MFQPKKSDTNKQHMYIVYFEQQKQILLKKRAKWKHCEDSSLTNAKTDLQNTIQITHPKGIPIRETLFG